MHLLVAGGTGAVGTAVVAEARRRGHAVRVISRREGVDAVTGVGLDAAVEGADAVIDVLGVTTLDRRVATGFFETTTRRLSEAESRAGVRHHIALSIVGVDRVPHGYYAAKLAQERAVESGGVPWTIQRTTQFHDFAAQTYRRSAIGPVHAAVRMRTQPVDVREVARRLVEIAEGTPRGRARDLAGPREEQLAEMMREWARHTGRRGWMPALALPGRFGRATRDGSVLPGEDADRGSVTFAEWLSTQPQG